MSELAADVSWRSGSIAPLLIVVVMLVPMVVIGWLTGARRARKTLRAAFDGGANKPLQPTGGGVR